MAERSWEHERAPDRRGRRRGWDEERYYGRRDERYSGEDDYGRHADDGDGHRDWADKATDEVKAWLGNPRAERRREMDRAREHRREQERHDFTGIGPRLRHDEDDDLRD